MDKARRTTQKIRVLFDRARGSDDASEQRCADKGRVVPLCRQIGGGRDKPGSTIEVELCLYYMDYLNSGGVVPLCR